MFGLISEFIIFFTELNTSIKLVSVPDEMLTLLIVGLITTLLIAAITSSIKIKSRVTSEPKISGARFSEIAFQN
jgi:hypothetical protein